MVSRLTVVLGTVLALAVCDARAELYKCVGQDGKVSYQGEPCTAAANEERLRAPPPGAEPAPAPEKAARPAAPGKDGWTEAQKTTVRSNCNKDAYADARRGWERSGDVKNFPETAVKHAVEKYCTCLTLRITSAVPVSQFSKDPVGQTTRMAADPGTECRMQVQMEQPG